LTRRFILFLICNLHEQILSVLKDFVFITNLKGEAILQLIVKLADNLVSKYRGFERKWQWYENYLTYGNALIPEAMLFAENVLK
jgi:hypothetical protein